MNYPCERCHKKFERRPGSRGKQCDDCRYRKNRDKLTTREREDRLKELAKAQVRYTLKYTKTPGGRIKKREGDKRWRERNKEYFSKYNAKWRKEHPGYGAKWRKKHPDYMKTYRASIKQKAGSVA